MEVKWIVKEPNQINIALRDVYSNTCTVSYRVQQPDRYETIHRMEVPLLCKAHNVPGFVVPELNKREIGLWFRDFVIQGTEAVLVLPCECGQRYLHGYDSRVAINRRNRQDAGKINGLMSPVGAYYYRNLRKTHLLCCGRNWTYRAIEEDCRDAGGEYSARGHWNGEGLINTWELYCGLLIRKTGCFKKS